jgi:casein kinase 1
MNVNPFLKGNFQDSLILNKLYFSHYKPLYILGSGSFGKVYCGINTETNEQFAMKFESKDKITRSFLEQEAHILLYLKGGEGIPDFYSYGYSEKFRILIYELLGKSINILLDEQTPRKFSIKTVCLLILQMICNYNYIIMLIN